MWHRGRSEGHARTWRTPLPKPPSRGESVGAARRAVRVTVAAVAGFYPAVDLLDRPVLALYTLFIPVAFGLLSPLPGCGRRRAGTVLRAVPAAAALIVLGTYLAAASWAAALGMLLVGFVLVLGASIGSRAAGVVPALQLSYILASFPPYAPAPCRTGWPDSPSARPLPSCASGCCCRNPDSRRTATGSPGASTSPRTPYGSCCEASPTAGRRPRRCGRQAGTCASRGHRPAAAPPEPARGTARWPRRDTRPAAASTCSPSSRHCCGHRWTCPRPPCCAVSRPPAPTRPARCAGRARAPTPGIEEMTAQYAATRGVPSDLRGDPHPLLSRQSTLLAVAVSAVTVSAAVALATGRRGPLPGLPREQFWYAGASTARLWWVRIADHVTPRSVVFQNAVRTASGLALARLVAGSLDLSHGFWVLLGMLTLGRTTAGATWSAVRGAAMGTLVGSLAAGALLASAGDATEVYAALLVPTMLVAFWAGPVGGPAWGQGLFTLVVSMAFAQIAPVTWQLAEARIVDVLTGSVIGLVCGVLAWPAGARAEMRRSAAALFRTTAPLVRVTVERTAAGHAAPTSRADAAPTLRRALLRWRIAHASYAQLRTEPPPAARRTAGPTGSPRSTSAPAF